MSALLLSSKTGNAATAWFCAALTLAATFVVFGVDRAAAGCGGGGGGGGGGRPPAVEQPPVCDASCQAQQVHKRKPNFGPISPYPKQPAPGGPWAPWPKP